MRILYWSSESDRFDKILDDLALHFELIEFSEIASVCDFISDESADAIIFNYDESTKEIDKAIKKIKKDFDLPIFLHSNNLNSKQLVKHQKSKTSADLYLRSPVSKELLLTMVAPFTDEEIIIEQEDEATNSLITNEDSTAEIDMNEFNGSIAKGQNQNEEVDLVINQHLPATGELSPEVKEINTKLNQQFSTVKEVESVPSGDEDLALDDNTESTEELIVSEDNDDGLLLLDDDAIEDDAELMTEENDDSDDLLSLDSDDSDDLLSLDSDDSDDLLSLDESESSDGLLEEEEDLLMLDDDLEEEAPPSLDTDDSLSLADDSEVDLLEIGDDEEQAVLETGEDGIDQESLDDDSMNLDLSESDELTLGEDEPIDSAPMDEGGLDLDLSSSDDLSLGDDEVVPVEMIDEGGLDLDLDASDDLVLGEDDEVAAVATEEEEGLDLDMSSNDELSLGDEDVEVDSVDSLDDGLDMDLDDDTGLELGDESVVENIEETEDELSSEGDMDLDDDLGLSLDSEDQSDDSLEFGDEDDSMSSDSIDELDMDSEEDQVDGEEISFGSEDEEDDFDSLDEVESGDVEESTIDDEEPQQFEDEDLFGTPAAQQTGSHNISEKTRVDDQSLEFSLSDANESSPDDFSSDAKMKLAEIDGLMGNSDSSSVESEEESVEEIEQRNNFVAEHQELKDRNNQQLEGLGITIKALRDDRALLMEKIAKLENQESDKKGHELNLKAQLDEKNIEVNVLRSRYQKSLENLKVELDISLEKKNILEEKSKFYEQKIEELNKKVRIDVNMVRQREKELENKLEMLRSDSEAQIRNRDLKILELKRKIDTLEFDLESVQSQEKKIVHNKYELEEKMEKVIDTLRGAIGELEEDGNFSRKIKNIKKNLDV